MTPGWTRAVRAVGSMFRTRFIADKSINTRCGLGIIAAAQFDAPPRVTNGMWCSAAMRTTATTSSRVRGRSSSPGVPPKPQ